MINPPPQGKPPKIQRNSINKWDSGTVTAYDSRRTPHSGLRDSYNMVLSEDGIPTPRMGLSPYGPPQLGKHLGEVFSYVENTVSGRVNHLMSIQEISGQPKLCRAKGEDSTWTIVDDTPFSPSEARFLQTRNEVLVMNGTDPLSVFNIKNNTLTRFTSITDPVAPTLKENTGLTGSSFKVFYAITANSSVGETKGSPVLMQNVSIARDLWNPDTQAIAIQWTAVPNAKSYNVYVGISVDGDGDPTLYQIASGLPPETLEFKDNGALAMNLSNPLPKDNSTDGPKVARGRVVNGRVWLVGDREDPYRIWHGGDPGHELDFSPSNGGGWSFIASGTKEVPSAVVQYRTGQGEPKLTVLSGGEAGTGKRFTLTSQQIAYGDYSFTVWGVQEETGTDGTDSPDSLVVYNNDLFYLSRDGFKNTGTRPQLQNVLATDRITKYIQPDVSTLSANAMPKCVGIAYDGRIYWSVAVGDEKNNQLWVYEPDRGGSWMKPLTIQADWMLLYDDNSGKTHHLIVNENGIFEMSKNNITQDNGVKFNTSGTSGQLFFEKTGREWARLLRVIFVVIRPQGKIDFGVSGLTEDGQEAFNISKVFGADADPAGWGMGEWGVLGWGDIDIIPKYTASESEEVELEIDEDMQWFKYNWRTTEKGVNYSISSVTYEYVIVGTKDLT